MSSTLTGGADRTTGLPPGVEVGGLGQRLVAYLIDVALVLVAGILLALVVPNMSGVGRIVLTAVLVLIIVVWAAYLVFRLGKFAATPGMAVTKLQAVGFYDGRPIGYSRAFIRAVILILLSASVIGAIIMAALMVLHPRHQGWHDLAVQSVLIKRRELAPSRKVDTNSSARVDQADGAPSVGTAQVPFTPPTGPATPLENTNLVAPSSPGSSPAPRQVELTEGKTAQPEAPEVSDPDVGDPEASVPEVGDPGVGEDEAVGPEASDREANDFVASDREAADHDVTAEDAVDEGTNGETAQVEAGWLAVLDDGRHIDIDGLVLLGRNPQPRPGEEDASLIKIADETRTVSKSHLAIGLDATGLFVVDRGSTNGSTVTTPNGISTRCGVDDIVYATNGTIVSLGDHWLEIRRG